MKIAFGMIVLDGDYVLKECLESIYPYATQILIAEGPVSYWQGKGRTTSLDKTNEILDSFPDPDNKIIITHGTYNEKDDQCNAYMKHLRPDIDYLWNLDSDEVFKGEDVENIIELLEKEQYTSVGFKSRSFYGGFDRYIGGFEEATDNFLRLFKVTPGCTWKTHRPPTIDYPESDNITPKHLDSDSLYEKIGFIMYHYSYVYPKQVYNKMNYYTGIGGGANRIGNYFFNVYWPWVRGNSSERADIEKAYDGVHEYLPRIRGESFTKPFIGTHPDAILNNMGELKEKFDEQVDYVKEKVN
jgi:hypothetical protein